MSIRLALSFFVVLGLGIAVLVFSIGPEVRWRASQTLASQAQRRIATKTFEFIPGQNGPSAGRRWFTSHNFTKS